MRSDRNKNKRALGRAFSKLNGLNALQIVMVMGAMVLLLITFSYSVRDTMDINRSKNIQNTASTTNKYDSNRRYSTRSIKRKSITSIRPSLQR